MRFSGIDVPEPLLEAQAKGTLVVFVGAGVSIPSGFPNYTNLANNIGREFGITREPDEPPDRYLGRIDENYNRAKIRAHAVFGDSTKLPCDLHRFIPTLFKDEKSIRIVTTNFDPLLSKALDERRSVVETYHAPAVPLGSDFSGLVYLHGSVFKEAKHFILTDSDFGHAYITHGWASLFLRSLFESFDVLFVGYSHSDPIMQYLARGLYKQNAKERYIVTDNTVSNWNLLKLVPIAYDPSSNHQQLFDFLKTWGQFTRSPLYDQEERLKELLAKDPADSLLDNDDEDFIRHVLNDEKKFPWFAQHASFKWTFWLQKEKKLSRLFNPHVDLSSLERKLSAWLADAAIRSKTDRHLFDLFSTYKHQLNPELASDLVTALFRHGFEYFSVLQLNSLVNTLARNTSGAGSDTWAFLLKKFDLPRDLSACMIVFEKLISPAMKVDDFSSRMNPAESSHRFEIKFEDNNNYWLREFWSARKSVILTSAHVDTFYRALKQSIEASYRLLYPKGTADEEFDRLSHARPAIEKHAQNHDFDDVFSFLADALAEILEWISKNDPIRTAEEIQVLARSKDQLFVRMAFYLAERNTVWDADQKANWALAREVFLQHDYHHESYSFLKTVYPALSSEMKERLLEYATTQHLPTDLPNSEEYAEWLIRSRIAWLKEASPDCHVLAKYIQSFGLTPEELASREHADFTSWSSGVHWVQEKSLYAAEEFVEGGIASKLSELLGLPERGMDQPSRYGVQKELEKAISLKPSLALELANLLIAQSQWDSYLWKAIFGSWENTLEGVDSWNAAFEVIRDHPPLLSHANELSRALYKAAEGGRIPQETYENAFELLEQVYRAAANDSIDETDDWLQRSINHASGNTILAWLRILSVSKTKELSERSRRFFEEVVTGTRSADRLAKSALASQTHYLFFLSQDWTNSYLLPLFRLSHQDWKPVWQGYLTWGRLTRDLVLSMMPAYLELLASAEAGDLSNRAIEFVSHMSLSGTVNPIESGLLQALLSQDLGEEFARQVSRNVRQMKPEDRLLASDAWLMQYLRMRLSSVYRALTSKEYDWILCIGLQLHAKIPEVVGMITSNPAMDSGGGWVFHEMKEDGISKTFPEPVTDVIDHLLPSQNQMHLNDLEDIVGTLIDLCIPTLKEKLLRICNHLTRLGSRRVTEFVAKLNAFPVS